MTCPQFLCSTATAIPSSRPEICRAPRAAAVKEGLLSAWRRMATAAEAAVNFARRRGAATTAKWQADYDAWQKRDLLLDAVVLSLQNGGGFKIPWRDDRRSASRVVSVLQTTPMRLDYETRSTPASSWQEAGSAA